ncbi:MAG TPA: pyridoxamine 5'-phosphate oxidase family protein [Methanocorpusculum sp.]|nr:pyridoxamine 5'-phosphate oxidase family protein [Methanocorpusculum sp.]HJK63044.1 pyridoxamine 5'-phosphate oxidase family protein [Methanocorpusculum sp.]HJK64864.1 pyridoxamine 5'-phosphate oxidase family protein [Methanocorpusculum sp.]HJK67827.1 pyridoxamine 5'-phosphate oxidase family protein [Methanocorpusculum sp.]
MRPMRRKAAQLHDSDAREILQTGIWGTLATADSGGQPYAVPMNYAVMKDTVYLHSAQEGHKLENLRENPLVSFSVVEKAEVLANTFDMAYRSVILFGTARFVEEKTEKQNALQMLMEKYSPDGHDAASEYINRNIERTAVIAIEIQHITAKAAN